ncbi:MFS transporter [Actinomycetaceae bacterium WB03_NA08]|uniref:MFS transporter n=1 Tax=Scrofimicrobium canadense TaxID=2652290 RepID=A0A6N7VTZ5_9ACTO|nr:MFS transporter [Scrofimicrobium canadense]MSS85249.1 MFS transporter [Scrofimicrobium canadense]
MTGKSRKREVLRILWGLLLALFVSNLSVTIVGNALPQIMAALDGSETQYTWIVTAVLLASTAATPIAGKLGDLFNKKALLLAAIGLFSLGSLLSGMVPNASWLIASRVLQGIGMGAQMALVQTVIASIVTPRERGQYNGYLGATMAVATVSGPLLGGLIVSTPWLGWRWTFWLSVPFSLIAIVVLWRYLKIPKSARLKPHIDYWGSALITAGVSLLLIWISCGGKIFPWVSPLGIGMPVAALLVLAIFVWVELHDPEPVVPLRLLTQRTPLLAVLASIGIGTALNAPPVFFGQYFQIAQGYSPALSGIIMVPLMLAMFLSSTISGQLVSHIGRWKRFVVTGLVAMSGGLIMMIWVGSVTPLWYIWIAMVLIGFGQGSSMQNLVLAVQNGVPLRDVGASTAMVTFFRSLGGAIGVQVAGIIYTISTEAHMESKVLAAGMPVSMVPDTDSLDITKMEPALQAIVRSAYGDAMGDIFMGIAVLGVLSLIAALFLPGSSLRDTLDLLPENDT